LRAWNGCLVQTNWQFHAYNAQDITDWLANVCSKYSAAVFWSAQTM